MSQPYRVADIHWPTHDKTVQTVEGPGIHHPDIREMFGDQPPVARLHAFADALNMAFVTGRRAAQADVRDALGLRSWGRDISLKD